MNNLKEIKVFIRNIIKEWYDEEYFSKKEKINSFNPEIDSDVKELYFLLTVDGIEDILDIYPKWVVQTLEDNGYIKENKNYLWIMSEEGLKKFPKVEDFKRFLLSEGGYIKAQEIKRNDSESSFLRGYESN